MKKLVYTALILSAGVGCNLDKVELDDVSLPNYKGTLAFPVGELTYTVRELFEEEIDPSLITVREDSVLVLTYRDVNRFDDTSEIIRFENITNSAILSVPQTAVVTAPTVVPINQRFTFSYQPETDAVIDSIVYKGGDLFFQVVSSFTKPIEYQITIFNTVNLANNAPVTFSGNVNANSTSEHNQSLANHTTFLEQNGDLNNFEANFSGSISLANGERITNNEMLSFVLIYRNQTFSSVSGFFGQRSVEVGNLPIDLSFFGELGNGFVFKEPEANLTFRNSYGVPMSLRLGSIFSRPADGGAPTFLEGPVTETPQPIASPTIDQFGETLESTIGINAENSNLRDLLSNAPDRLGLVLEALMNPNSTRIRNFVSNEAEIEAEIEVKLPMTVQLNDLQRTVYFDYDDIDVSDADSIALRIVTENELPFSAELSLQFLDKDETVLHEVPDNLVLAAPFINLAGKVTGGRINIGNVPVSRAGLDAFTKGSILALVFTFNTPQALNSQEIFVDILSQYTLEIKVSVVAKLDLES